MTGFDTRVRANDATETTGESETECAECGSSRLVIDASRGEHVCADCGLVVEEALIDRGPEWRAFDYREHEEKSRVGAPITRRMHDMGLTTTIDWRDEDSSGRTLSPEKRAKLRRLRQWQERIRTNDADERNLQFALSEIDRMASALGVPRSVREVAAVIYRRAVGEDLIRGRSIEGVASAALYAACRRDGTPRTLEEVTGVSRVPRKEVGRTYRYVAKELDLELEPVDPSAYVPRFCSALDLDERVQRTAAGIVSAAAERGMHAGKSPPGFAAAAIYLASQLCGDERTQRAVADVADVTTVTIRKRHHEQREVIGDLSIDG